MGFSAVNDAPTLSGTQAALAAGTEDTAYTVSATDLLAGFSDADGDALSITGLTASNGTVLDNNNGSYTITPAANFNGTVTLNYSVTDGTTSTAAANTVGFSAVNDAPTLSLTGTVAVLAENTPTTSRIKLADIVISDDDQGSATITLAGADAASFEVEGTELFLKAGTALDFETKSAYAVTVSASDPTLPGSTTVSADFSLALSNVPEPAVISLPSPFANTVTEDVGIDAFGFLATNGIFGISDSDAGQAAFKTTVGVPAGVTNLGSLTISTAGAFNYQVRNSLDDVQALRAGETRSDVFTIESLDGTKLDVTFSIVGVADEITGVVSDGYLAGATVFADTNRNREFDTGELFTTTDDAGNFSFDFGSLTAPLISIGGIDVSTGLPFRGSLAAPAQSSVINPLTTLLMAIVDAGGGPSDSVELAAAVDSATAQIVASLGLPAVNLTTFDPLAPAADPVAALVVQMAAATIANVIVVGDTIGADSASILNNLVSAVTTFEPGQVLDLSSTTVLSGLLTTPTTQLPDLAAIDSLAVANTQIMEAGSIGAIAELQTAIQAPTAFVYENSAVDTVVFQAATPAGMTAPVFSLKGIDDGALMSIDPATGAVRFLAPADFETKASYGFTAVASQQGQAAVETAVTVQVVDVNEAPTAVALSGVTSSLTENTSTANRIRVADIAISDDALGSAAITLAGADAASFEVIGSELFLKAGTALDFETKSAYAVTVSASDPSLPGSTPVSVDFSLAVSDINEQLPPRKIRATSGRDTLIGTPGKDTFIFKGIQSNSTVRKMKYDTIVGFEQNDQISFRGYSERVMGSPRSTSIRKLQAKSRDLSSNSISKILGSKFDGSMVAALEIRGHNGTFLAVNAKSRSKGIGSSVFDHSDMLIFMKGYDLDKDGPILLA